MTNLEKNLDRRNNEEENTVARCPLPVPYEATASVENDTNTAKKKQPIPVYVVDQQKQSLLSDMKQAIADAVNKYTLDKPNFTTFSDHLKQDGIEVILYQTAGRKRKGRYKLKYRYRGGIGFNW